MARPAKSMKIQLIEGNTNNKTREEIARRAKAEEKFDVVSSEKWYRQQRWAVILKRYSNALLRL